MQKHTHAHTETNNLTLLYPLSIPNLPFVENCEKDAAAVVVAPVAVVVVSLPQAAVMWRPEVRVSV